MKRALLTILCVIVVSGNVMLQTADHTAFVEVFKTYVKCYLMQRKSSEFGGRLFTELASLIQKGATLQDLNDHVEELRKHIADDEAEDEKYFNDKQSQLEAGLQGLVDEVEQLAQAVTASQARLNVLTQQQQIIDGLFANDQKQYQKRLGDQNSVLEVIDQLLERVHVLVQEGHSLIEKDNLLEEIKQLGRGKHIEVLAQVIKHHNQITSHLDQEQVERILELFSKLKEAVLKSLEADEAKEQENIRLYNKLSSEIANSLTETAQQHQQLDDQHYAKQLELNAAKQDVTDVGEKLQDRNDQRQFILDRVEEAQELLNNNLDRIARWSVEDE